MCEYGLRFVLLRYLEINMPFILCISDFELQCKVLEKFSSEHATKNHSRRCFVCSAVPHPYCLRPECYRSDSCQQATKICSMLT